MIFFIFVITNLNFYIIYDYKGGIFHDCIVHDLDMLRNILHEDPETIYSIGNFFFRFCI